MYKRQVYGGPEPSGLIDAGQWVLIAEKYASMAARPGVEVTTARVRLRAAMAAILEVRKFGLPLPDSAFWTSPGRRLHAEQPERFTGDALDRAWEGYDLELTRLGPELPPALTDPEAIARRQARDRVEREWLARHGLGDERDASPEQRSELTHALRRLAGLDVATGFSLGLERSALSAYDRVWRETGQRFAGDPAERDRRLAAIAALRAAWGADDHVPPAGSAWELVRAVRTAAGQDPETGEFVR